MPLLASILKVTIGVICRPTATTGARIFHSRTGMRNIGGGRVQKFSSIGFKKRTPPAICATCADCKRAFAPGQN